MGNYDDPHIDRVVNLLTCSFQLARSKKTGRDAVQFRRLFAVPNMTTEPVCYNPIALKIVAALLMTRRKSISVIDVEY